MEAYDAKRELQDWLSGAERIVVAGIGNPLRGDDFVGLKIVQDLEGKVSQKVLLVECETVPESFMQEIIEFRPTHVLVVDAALLDEPTGSVRLLEDLKGALPTLSTHMLPLQIFCAYLRSASGAKVAMLAIQPGKTNFGEALTGEVEDSAEGLVEILKEILSDR